MDQDFLNIFLDEACETLELWEATCLGLEKEFSQAGLDALFRCAHNLKGSSKSVGLNQFGELVHKAEDVISKIKTGDLTLTNEIISVLLNCQNFLAEWASGLKVDPGLVRDDSEIKGQLLAKLNSEAKSDAPSSANEGFGFFDEAPAKVEKTEGKINEKQTAKDGSLRVSLKKIDTIIRMIGELSIQHSIVFASKESDAAPEAKVKEAISLSHKIIQDLQAESMAMRMQSLEGLFQRMERVCRDVARLENKPVEIILKGSEVELDKIVIERIKDPLVHILRNAVDHGIEKPEQRQSSGKNPVARITLEGIQSSSQVSIRVTDDGKGLNKEKILAKAKERKLIEDGQELTDKELFNLIFLPGFSTAEKITEVSGRGVGMDVVKKVIDELKGEVSIDSESGKGTRFTITLPSTMSILDAIIVGVEDSIYAIPVNDVDEVVDLSSISGTTPVPGGEIINLRDHVIPVESLSSYLPSKGEGSRGEQGVALVTQFQTKKIAFKVDKIAGQQTIVVRQLEGSLSRVPGFAGGTILASGEPSMIVNLSQLIKSFNKHAG